MIRTTFMILILALLTLALLPNPENPTTSEWANLPRHGQAEPALLIQALEALGLRIPKELLPGLGLIALSVFLSWIGKGKTRR